jgi:hypothetical protein
VKTGSRCASGGFTPRIFPGCHAASGSGIERFMDIADDWHAEEELDGMFRRIAAAKTLFEVQVVALILWHQMKDTKEGLVCAYCLLNQSPAPNCVLMSEDELYEIVSPQGHQLFLALDFQG